jgi:hypothetical protein
MLLTYYCEIIKSRKPSLNRFKEGFVIQCGTLEHIEEILKVIENIIVPLL